MYVLFVIGDSDWLKMGLNLCDAFDQHRPTIMKWYLLKVYFYFLLILGIFTIIIEKQKAFFLLFEIF